MKFKTLAAMLVALSVCALSACTTGNVQAIQPAQIAAVACPQLNLVHTQLVALNTALEADPKTVAVGTKAAAQLAAIQPVVNGVCNGAAGVATVNFANIQSLVQTGFPALATLVASLPIPAAQQAEIQAALAVAETAAGVVSTLQQQIQAKGPGTSA